jgi:hypothetical protein
VFLGASRHAREGSDSVRRSWGPRDRVLDEIQKNLLARARQFREDHTSTADTWEQFVAAMTAGRASSLRRGAAERTVKPPSKPKRRQRCVTSRWTRPAWTGPA